MDAGMESLVGHYEGRGGIPDSLEMSDRRKRRWRLSIAAVAVLLVVLAAMAAGSLLSSREAVPMLVEPKAVLA